MPRPGCCARAANGIRPSEHMDGESDPAMFRHAGAMGLEGIVSDRAPGRPPTSRTVTAVRPTGAMQAETRHDPCHLPFKPHVRAHVRTLPGTSIIEEAPEHP
jgi:hypothetical protein